MHVLTSHASLSITDKEEQPCAMCTCQSLEASIANSSKIDNLALLKASCLKSLHIRSMTLQTRLVNRILWVLQVGSRMLKSTTQAMRASQWIETKLKRGMTKSMMYPACNDLRLPLLMPWGHPQVSTPMTHPTSGVGDLSQLPLLLTSPAMHLISLLRNLLCMSTIEAFIGVHPSHFQEISWP